MFAFLRLLDMKFRQFIDRVNLQIIKTNAYFLVPFFVVCIVSIASIFILGNSELYLFINQQYSGFTDFLFLSFTHLGDGVIAGLFIFILMWVSLREALTFLIITLLITLLVMLCRRYFFGDLNRPIIYLGEQFIRLVPGYTPPKLNTFPSGHTATAFSVYFYLAILVKQKGIKFGLFLIACTIGYSRLYLSAHFPADVVAGAMFAVLITLATYFYFRKIKWPWIDRRFCFDQKRLIIIKPIY